MQDKIKGIFDNIRNYGIAAIVFSVGVVVWGIKAPDTLGFYYYKVVSVSLIGLSVFLIFANAVHAVYVMFPGVGPKSKAKVFFSALLFIGIYMTVTLPVFPYLAGKELKQFFGVG